MKIKQTFETEAYLSDGGYYVIRQTGEYGNENDVVMLSPDQMRVLIADMQKKLASEKDWWLPITDEE